MTTTENVNPEHATDLLIKTSVNHPDGQIGTPTSSRRNYSLAEAMACAAICERFTLHDFNGITILTGHNQTVGDYRWYIDTTPRPANPWKA